MNENMTNVVAVDGAMGPRGALAVDLKEAGRMMGVSAKTVKREILRGRLKALKVGSQWRVRMAEIEDYLRRGERKGGWA